jgi:D-inositol-3-phosphate glycosyltransferase
MKSMAQAANHQIAVGLLTGGSDKPYVHGLSTELLSKGLILDLIGSDELDCPEVRDKPGLNFLNLRGAQRSDVGFLAKMDRIIRYYLRLIIYAASAEPKIFHILWNNKFETFDRTLLMLYYKCLGKQVVLTAHNINAAKRDSKDSSLNRLTLCIQYMLADHIFVHTDKMKQELVQRFRVTKDRVTVIPFGINNSVPNSELLTLEAKNQLRIYGKKTVLFFGRITPYKGLEYLISAFRQVASRNDDYRLIIAGRPDCSESYWTSLRDDVQKEVATGRILLRSEFIPDAETEIYFKAADVLVLPYREIYQSGVLFLAHSFGLPVLAADVGSLKEDIIAGRNGDLFTPEDPSDLARTIERYFNSDLFANLGALRQEIRDAAEAKHSWDVVGQSTVRVYAALLRRKAPGEVVERNKGSVSPSN